MSKEKKTFVIIDGHAIIHRAYHALPPMSTKDGTIVNAVYGFTSMLLKVIDKLQPDYIAVSFDVAGGTFRDDIYEDYKATREKAEQELYDQIPFVYDMVNAFNIPIFEKEGFEADDIIGTITHKLQQSNDKGKTDLDIVIVTGDMDILQLVHGDIKVFGLRKGMSDTILYNRQGVIDKFGFGPECIVDYKAFRGDTSDNIPGVRGIGDKTAKILLAEVGDIDEIYKQLADESSKVYEVMKPGALKKLKEGEDDARMSHDLATIRTNVAGLDFKLPDCVTHEFDREEVTTLLKDLEFFSLIKRLPGEEQPAVATPRRGKKAKRETVVVDAAGVDTLLEHIEKEKQFVCGEVLSGSSILDSALVGLVFVLDTTSYYVDFGKLTDSDVKKLLMVFTKQSYTLIGHDLKQLIKALLHLKVSVKNKLFDIMIASYLINSSTRAHDLRAISMRELDKEIDLTTSQATLFGADPNVITAEQEVVHDVATIYMPQVVKEIDKKLFDEIEMALIPVLAQMELNGIGVDTERLGKMSRDVAKTIAGLEKNIWNAAGEEFNVASSVQLREILFEKLKLPTAGIKKGKTGYSTAASELEKLAGTHDIIEFIGQYREIEKLRNTYIDVLPTLINEQTGRIHTSYNQAVTTTGRLSSSDPNLQNIPIRSEMGKEIRDAFVAEQGYSLVAADYSQIELRIAASLANDKELINIFKSGKDVHSATAAAIHSVEIEDVTPAMRRKAKEVNFGVMFGMGVYGLASRTGISQKEAKAFIDKYFDVFSGLKKYLDDTLKQAKQDGYTETLFKRRRYIPELTSSNFQIRSAGERMAINMPLQGTEADMMKLAMVEVQKRIVKEFGNDDVRLLLQVHDELVLEVKQGLEKQVMKMVEEAMEGVITLKVPVDVEAHVGKRWGEMK